MQEVSDTVASQGSSMQGYYDAKALEAIIVVGALTIFGIFGIIYLCVKNVVIKIRQILNQ